MRLLKLSCSLLLILFLMNGCVIRYNAEVKPPIGILNFFAKIKAPLTLKFDNTPCDIKLIKTSFSKTHYFHVIFPTNFEFAWGDLDIPMMAMQAGIKKVAYADYELINILGIYAQFTVNIYGYPIENLEKITSSQ